MSLGRFAFRFVFVYAGLYLLGQWLFLVPGLEIIGRAYAQSFERVDVWTGQHLLGISAPIDRHTLGTGSGDTLLNYLELFVQSAAAFVAALTWTLVDRKRRSYETLHHWLRAYMRYSVGGIMLNYGFAKVFFPGQFAHPTLDRLIEPFGHSSPMGLLWTFMGYSKPYTMFTGAVECLGGLLLFSQRTTMLGALVVAAAMGNVAMLNFSYDVPVKLYSAHLFLFAIFLLVPEAPRLVRVFVTNRATDPMPLRPPFTRLSIRRAAVAVKWLLVAAIVWSNVQPRIAAWRQPPRQPVAYSGIYEVESFAPTDAKRWRRVIINEAGGLSVQTMDDATIRYRTKKDPKNHTYELSTIFSPYEKIVLTYREPEPEQLALEGQYGGQPISVTLRKVPTPPFLLNERVFHWVSEYPYNR